MITRFIPATLLLVSSAYAQETGLDMLGAAPGGQSSGAPIVLGPEGETDEAHTIQPVFTTEGDIDLVRIPLGLHPQAAILSGNFSVLDEDEEETFWTQKANAIYEAVHTFACSSPVVPDSVEGQATIYFLSITATWETGVC